MTLNEVMAELKKLGTEQTLKTWRRHGAEGDMFGVKIGDMKTVVKKIKGDHELALSLYQTGNLDAMYLAGLVVDSRKMTRKELNVWVKAARWTMLSEYSVAWVAAESPFAHELALEWMKSKKESIACAGWNTYSGLMALKPDEELDLPEIEKLLDQIAAEIHRSPNRVRYVMNSFVVAVGAYVKPLLSKAKAVAKKVGKVEVDVGDTDCKIPLASDAIAKIESLGRVGKKRKTVKC